MRQITFYILLIALLTPTVLLGQNDVKPIKYNANFELGEQYYKRYAYRIAIKHYKNAFAEDTISSAIKLRLAQCYYRMRDLRDAEIWASKVVAGGYEPNAEQIYRYVEILASNQHYDEASYWYSRYLEKDSTNTQRIERMKRFLNSPDFEKQGDNYQIHQVNFNSNKRDFSPTFYKDGLVFVSARKGGFDIKRWFKSDGVNYLNLYYTEPIDSISFSDPEVLGGLKTRYHEGPLAFYDNDTKVIFTRSNVQKRSLLGKKAGQSADGSTVLKLYMADVFDDKITNVREFPYNSDEFSTGHPTVSEDGRRLIFVSNRPDGHGGSDLYISYRVADSWTPPVNLGTDINTPEQELFPYLNGNVLYFSSDGRPGLGGLDAFYTTLVNDKPTEIATFTYPINSPADDFGLLTKTGRDGYFASNRGQSTNDNIYYGIDVKPRPDLSFVISVVDSISKETLMEPEIQVIDTLINEMAVAYDVVKDTSFAFVAEQSHTYRVVASHEGYFTDEFLYYSGDSAKGCLKWRVPLLKITKDVAIELDDIFYDFDKASLRDTSLVQLNYVIKWMENNPSVRIEVSAHTDSRGRDEYNMHLSERRAQSVTGYLIESGIDSTRLVAKGYGETKPIVSCPNPADCSEEDHQRNRRTELKVIDETYVAPIPQKSLPEPESASVDTTAVADLNSAIEKRVLGN